MKSATWLGLLLALTGGSMGVGAQTASPPATTSAVVPVQQKGMAKRHGEKVEAQKAHAYDLLLVGDSITHNFDRPAYQDVWNLFFAPRNAINLGYSGGRTENTLWNLLNGELENQHPKVITLLIGTNNSDDANYPVVHQAEEIFAGTQAIIALIRERLPDTKILLLRIFPRTNRYKHPDGSPRGSMEKRFETNLRAGALVAELADDKNVFFLDVNHAFLNLDGSLNPSLMPDLLHPSPEGARVWAEAMEPLLAQLFGDAPRISPPTNNTLIPVPKLERDFYDWWKRHEEILRIKKDVDPEIVLVGDSITHLWGAPPSSPKLNGPKSFAATFAGRRVLNLGYGYDRIQNVLWRLDHGEIDGTRPQKIIVNIGTNNLRATPNARANTPDEIVEGIQAVLLRLRAKAPQADIMLMGIFPRGQSANDALRAPIAKINDQLKKLTENTGISFLDLTGQMVEADGSISREIMSDFLHPTEKGYAVWGHALQAWLK